MKRLGIIGLGNMGGAILKGIIENRIFIPRNIYINDINKSKVNIFVKKGVVHLNSNSDIADICDVIILAVKPQEIRSVLSELKPGLNKTKTIISIAAGIRISFIERILGNKLQVVRVMPNMPFLVGSGISAISRGAYTTKSAMEITSKIFSSSGMVLEVKEKAMDVVTAISGSGPAYFFLLIDSILKSGIELGLDKKTAEKLASYTAFGSANLLLDLKLSPEELISKIASKGGTTEAALKIFKKYSFDRIVKEAIKNASKRSNELGDTLCLS